MPDRPLVACAVPGCPARVVRGRCDAHRAPVERQRERDRPNRDTRRWYRIDAWTAVRRIVLAEAQYTCAACGLLTVNLHVDHIRKHNGDPALFWGRSNLQALCPRCHQQKTERGE